MPVHPHPKGLDALQEEERIERAHAWPEVPKPVDTAFDDERNRPEYLPKLHSVIGRRRIIQHREVALLPWEFPAVHDDAADAGAVAAHELRERVNNNVGAVVDRPAEIRGGERVVDNERNVVLVGDVCNRLDVEDVAARIAD